MAQIFDNFNTKWENFHRTVNQTVNQVTVIANDRSDSYYDFYTDSLNQIKFLIGRAISTNRKIKVSGGKWSFTEIGFSEDFMITPTNLNKQRRLQDNDLDANCAFRSENLIICQSGAKIKTISRKLKRWNKSLDASGASNGQTIAGAIGTGTHGSAIDFGSVQEMVQGLHIIVDGNRSVLLERASQPITNQSFQNNIDADIIRDDDMFNAALVGLGSFGYLYGVILKVSDAFLLKKYVQPINFSDLEKLLDNNLDFQSSNFEVAKEVGNTPYHFKVLVNPYKKDCLTEVMYKKPFDPNYKKIDRNSGNYYNPDLLSVIGKITKLAPITTPAFIQALGSQVMPKENFDGEDGTLADHFWDTTTAGHTFSTAIGIPIDQSRLAINTLIELIENNTNIPAILALRFVKGTKALMGFTHFDRTCILEIDGVRNSIIDDFIKKIPPAFKAKGIDFSFHWGKFNPLDAQMVKDIYKDRFELWKNKRSELMNKSASDLYCSAYAQSLGLCAVGSSPASIPVIT